MELVTGKAGTPHVSSADDGRRIAGEVGMGSYVLQTGGKLAPSLVDSNTVRFATGDLIVQGRHIGVTEPEDVKVSSGTQGKKRMDYICIHYTKDVSGGSPTLVEKVEWKVLQGTPGDTATAPTVPAGSIIDGDAEATVPIASVTFDGLTTGEPKLLITLLEPLSLLEVNIVSIPINNSDIKLKAYRCGTSVTVSYFDIGKGFYSGDPGAYVKLGTMPAEFRPKSDLRQFAFSEGGAIGYMYVGADGSIGFYNHGSSSAIVNPGWGSVITYACAIGS